jgi:hypothetical protein
MDRNETLQRATLAFRRAVLGLWTCGAIAVWVWPG